MCKSYMLRLISFVFLCSVIVAGCSDDGGETDPAAFVREESPIEVQAAEDSPVATPTVVDTLDDQVTVTISGKDRVQLEGILPLTINVEGEQPIVELHLEAQLPMLYLRIVGLESGSAKAEVESEFLGEVVRNEVDENGRFYFTVRNLDLSQYDEPLYLCMIPLRALMLGQEDLEFYRGTVTSPTDDQTLEVELPPLFNITVQEEPVDDEDPTPSPTSEPTEPSEPTSTPTIEATPTVKATPTSTPGDTPTPMPTVSWTPAPLPPLSELTDPITPLADSIYYRIHPKQTLYRLSQTFDTTVEAIAAANGIQDSSDVKAGTVLRIPVKPPSGKAAYLVSSKETLYSIAHAFGLEVEELGAMNYIGPADYDDIDIGQWLVLIPDD